MSDLTRYRIDCDPDDPWKAEAERYGYLIPDSTLQDIANAWRETDKRWWNQLDNPLAALLDGLEGTDKC